MTLSEKLLERERNLYPGDDRPILIGQAPGPKGDPTKPLTGKAGKALAILGGVGIFEFCLSVVRVNTIPYFPGRLEEGDAFPMKEARMGASKIRRYLAARRVVFVGRVVAQAFGHGDAEWFTWDKAHEYDLDGCMYCYEYAVMPHPSGRNRFWNDPDNTERAVDFMCRLLDYKSSCERVRGVRRRARAMDQSRSSSKKQSPDHSMSSTEFETDIQRGAVGGSSDSLQERQSEPTSASSESEIPRA